MGNTSTRFGSKRDITLILLGLDNAGKTTILENLANEDTDEEQIPTMGYSSRRITKGRYNILLMDLGGGPDIRGIWPKYYAETHGVVYVVDTSDRDRMNESKEVLQEVLKDERMTCKPLLLLCNKADKKERTMGVVEVLEGLDLVNLLKESASIAEETEQPKTRMWLCSGLKSKTGDRQDKRLKKAFRWLLGSVTQHWEVLSPRVRAQHGVELEKKERERRERIERRRRKIEEEERLEAEGLKAAAAAAEANEQQLQPKEIVDQSSSTPVLNVTVEHHDDISVKSSIALLNKTKLPPIHVTLATEPERRDSGISVQEESTHNVEGEGPITIKKIPEPPSEPAKKKISKQPGRIVMRLKNRNKTFPANGELPSPQGLTGLAEAPPLMSPWVTPSTKLPIGHDEPTKSDSVKGEPSLTNMDKDHQMGIKDTRQTLPPLISTNHPTERVFILPEDTVLKLPVAS